MIVTLSREKYSSDQIEVTFTLLLRVQSIFFIIIIDLNYSFFLNFVVGIGASETAANN